MLTALSPPKELSANTIMPNTERQNQNANGLNDHMPAACDNYYCPELQFPLFSQFVEAGEMSEAEDSDGERDIVPYTQKHGSFVSMVMLKMICIK